MFQSARLKLTAWYLLIIIAICFLFSFAFYSLASREIQRVIVRIETRHTLPPNGFFIQLPTTLHPQELATAKHRLILFLLFINGGIIVLSGGAAYFLAGKTLRPIKIMVDEQNRFITDASHELRTPLTALRSEMEAVLLEKDISSKDTQSLIKSNLEEVEHLQVLAESLLQLTQLQTTAPHKEEVSLLQAVEDALKTVAPLARGKNIIIRNEINDAQILANNRDIVELVIILLDNAIKYSPSDTSIQLASKLIDHSIVISVRDRGIGIEKKDISHIFDRFYQVDASRTKKESSGYGLGLSIAKQIVEMYHGSISVKSKIGKGTTFTIIFPVHSA